VFRKEALWHSQGGSKKKIFLDSENTCLWAYAMVPTHVTPAIQTRLTFFLIL